MFPPCRIAGIALVIAALIPARAQQGATVYATDFNSFPLGDDTVVGTDGWNGNNTGLGVHGTDAFITGLGRSVFLGGVRPATTFTTLFRTVNFDAVEDGTPVVVIDAAIGIQDSTNGRRDSFFLSVYNISGQFLGALEFDNTPLGFGLWRSDGVSSFDTGEAFVRNELMLVTARIDLAANTWSVFIDDNPPIFEDAPFNASGQALDLGSVAFEWKLAAALPGGFGDNFMLFDDLGIRAFPAEDPRAFTITSITRASPSTGATITWLAEPGFSYQVEYSSDLSSWLTDLPDSSHQAPASTTSYTFTDPAPANARFYRVVRTSTTPAP